MGPRSGYFASLRPVLSRVEKVVCYVIRGDDLLVFTHDEVSMTVAGVQVPAGTIEAGETASDAAVRELAEESGLVARSAVHLGTRDYDMRPARQEIAVRHFFLLEVDEIPTAKRWRAAETDPTSGGEPIPWTCWWLSIHDAHVLAGGLGMMLGTAYERSQRGALLSRPPALVEPEH